MNNLGTEYSWAKTSEMYQNTSIVSVYLMLNNYLWQQKSCKMPLKCIFCVTRVIFHLSVDYRFPHTAIVKTSASQYRENNHRFTAYAFRITTSLLSRLNSFICPQIKSNAYLVQSYVLHKALSLWKQKARILKYIWVSGCCGSDGLYLLPLMKNSNPLSHAPLLKSSFILSWSRCSWFCCIRWNSTTVSKILWNEFEAEESNTTRDLLLRKHIFLKNNTFIFISLQKGNVSIQ